MKRPGLSPKWYVLLGLAGAATLLMNAAVAKGFAVAFRWVADTGDAGNARAPKAHGLCAKFADLGKSDAPSRTPSLQECQEDDNGAWALGYREPDRPIDDPSCPNTLQSIERLAPDGRTFSLSFSTRDGHDCKTDANARSDDEVEIRVIGDLDKDGIPEVLLLKKEAYPRPEMGALYTFRENTIKPYSGTDGVPVSDVSDVDHDGLLDLSYRYWMDGGYDAGCGGMVPIVYGPTYVAYGRADGHFDFFDPRSVTQARKMCPRPPENAGENIACARVWGFGSVEDVTRAERTCAKQAASPVDDGEPGCHPDPVRDACSYFQAWKHIARATFPLRLWPPLESNRLTRMPEGSTPGETSGGRTKCPVEITVLESNGPTAEAWQSEVGSRDEDWPQAPTPGDSYREVACGTNAEGLTCYEAVRSSDWTREAAYQQAKGADRPTLCRSEQGCQCSEASPCAKGFSALPEVVQERVFVSEATKRVLVRARWPKKADPKRKLSIEAGDGTLRVKGLGCSETVKLAL